MLRIYSCIVHEHDIRLVLVAAAICLVATFTTFATLDHARRGGRCETAWIALAAFVSAVGIWSTHFVSMLAYSPGIPIGYDLRATLFSVLAAVAFGCIGWWTFTRNHAVASLAGGALIGASIATMHYIGMSAVHMAGHIEWDWGLVAVSLILGAVLSIAAVAEYRRRPQFIAWRPAVLLASAICSLHFVAMSAAVIHPNASEFAVEGIDSETLAVIISCATLLIMLISLAVVLFQRKLARLQMREAQRLKIMQDAVLEGDQQRARLTCELKQQADICSAALNCMAQGLSMYDEHDRLVTFNRRYAELYNMPIALLARGTSFADVLAFHIDNGNLPKGNLEHYLNATGDSQRVPGHSEIGLRDGRVIDVQRRPLPNGGWVATHEDITQRSRAAERSEYLATHDDLTGLPNRASFGEGLQAAIAKLGGESLHALLLVDLDRFKEVNDTLGHPIGDELLKQVAARLREVAGEDEVVSRLAGDEFAVIQRDLDRADDAGTLASRIIAALSSPFEFDGRTIAVGASVGIALAPQDSRDAAELLKKSDLALYWAKNVGRGGFCFYKPRMDKRLNEQRELGNDLRIAVQKGQFELYYQPLLNLSSRRISGLEALVRWHHPSRGMLQPSDFIPTAEESGLIIPIGEWVLRQACAEASKWPDSISVAVNLSAAQFKRGDLLAMTTAALKAAGLPAGRLEFEITESVLLNDEAWVRKILGELRELGVRIAMDDFGTGYSSLSYLRSFPFSKIKIDQSFVSDITVTRDALAIVQATIQLSEKLGMRTTAEGIETIEQMNMLTKEGCTEGQGFQISPPVRAEEIPALIRRYGCHVEMRAYRVAS